MSNPLINTGHVHEVYTNGETVVGYWLDGKPIYRRVVPFTVTGNVTAIDTGTANIAQVVRMDGIINMGGAWRNVPWAYAEGTGTSVANYIGAYVDTNGSRIVLLSGSRYPYLSGYIMLEYTKTTD